MKTQKTKYVLRVSLHREETKPNKSAVGVAVQTALRELPGVVKATVQKVDLE